MGSKNDSEKIHSIGFLILTYVISLFAAAFLNAMLSSGLGIETPKNIGWTALWIWMTIISWKYMGVRALIFYPLYILISNLGVLLLPDILLKVIFAGIANIGGLACFAWFFYKAVKAYSSKNKKASTTNNSSGKNWIAHKKQPPQNNCQLNEEKPRIDKIDKDEQEKLSLPAFDEEKAWEQALNEFESSEMNKGIWAKAYSNADGDEKKAKANYLKIRVQQLIVNYNIELKEQREKMKDEEEALRNANAPEKKVVNGREFFLYSNGVCEIVTRWGDRRKFKDLDSLKEYIGN